MQGIRALQSVLDNLTYKEGWEFKILHNRAYSGIPWALSPDVLKITFWAKDAYNPGQKRHQEIKLTLPPYEMVESATEEHWAQWLFHIIVYIEEHEAAEFLLINGKRIFDPHAPNFRSIVGGIPKTIGTLII